MKASDLFLRCLEAQGVDTIYGVPGEENADLMISLLNSSITFITCRHEQSAAFMADMHGRLTGKPGVCLATLGPGATNLLTGVANANIDHAPLIAIVGQADTNRLHKESHQNMNAVEMYTPITKWATSIREASVIPEVISKAFKVAQAPKPGAVMIELPEDIAKAQTDLEPLPLNYFEYEAGGESHYLTRTLDLIESCHAPLILVGYSAAYSGCDHELNELMDKTGIYGATTFMGKGAISSRHHQSLQCVGLGVKDIALEAFDRADLVICIGYGMVEWHPDRWNSGQKKNIIHIDVTPAEVDKNYIPSVELIGNIRSTLKQINSSLNEKHRKNQNLFTEIRQRIMTDLAELSQDTSFPLKPQRVLSDLRAEMNDSDILISDVGAHKMWIARQYFTYQSNTCLISNGFCSMGGAIPGAIAAKQILPQKNIVALCGDGGFMMSIQALVTAVELNLPIVVMIWNDNCYGLIKWKQEISYHTYSHVDLVNPDFAQVSRALGCHADTIHDVKELIPKLRAAFAEKNKPTVLVIPIDYSENMKLTKRLGEIVSH